jgi:hypothetical protein
VFIEVIINTIIVKSIKKPISFFSNFLNESKLDTINMIAKIETSPIRGIILLTKVNIKKQ